MSVQDFRKDKILRSVFIQGIGHLYAHHFSNIDAEFEQQVRDLGLEEFF